MPRHLGTRQSRSAGGRRLLLGYADLLILTFCCLGILAAWLIYGAAGAGHGAAGTGPEVRYAPAAPITQFPHPLQAIQPAGGQPRATSPAAGNAPAAVRVPAAGTAASAKAAPPKPVVVTAAPPQRIIYPAAGMDVVVHPLKPDGDDTASRSIVPPETMDGYWLTPFGRPGTGSVNTTYVVGHSWEGQDAPFNHLSSSAAPGDVFTVVTPKAKLLYRVDSVTTYTKSSLKDSSIWDVVPNRLVLISCYTEDLWGKNVALVASPAQGK